MKIVYYTYPAFLDTALGLFRSLGRDVELHVLLEIAPESKKGTVLDLTTIPLGPGIHPAAPILDMLFPRSASMYWKNLKTFHFVVFNNPRSLHPDTFTQGHAIANFIQRIQPDVIFFDGPSLRIGLASIFLRATPWVIGVHDPQAHMGESDWRLSLTHKLMFPNAKRFILHNRSQQREFTAAQHIAADQVAAIPLGVYDIYKHWKNPAVPASSKEILFFGRISPYKGLDVLLEAAPLVARQVGNVTFNIVGRPVRGYEMPSMPALPNGGKIHLVTEYVSVGELAHYFSRAACVVCPYVEATQSGVVLTAYAFGIPVIATRTGGLPEYVRDGETGLLVEPHNVPELANALLRYLENESLQQELQKGASSVADQALSWDQIALQYEYAFQETIQAAG
jgi:glycosyltransferase involved in cell wall biosynthesis